ncbi:MAG: radical SAM protein [Bacteroidales bacterium]|nr:radical SAM protein [Bacteroidales bacterium]
MATFLFDKIIFGPVKSRRLGVSLGVNLLPADRKVCNFNCIYCECGWTREEHLKSPLPSRDDVRRELALKLQEMKASGTPPDVITFAGNGEPTIHPDFPGIIDDTIALRDELCPGASVAVLSNATMINRPEIRDALLKTDRNILKLDSAFDETVQLHNQPGGNYSVAETINQLRLFRGDVTIQTLFLRGEYKGSVIDNTTPRELEAWLGVIASIAPREVMIYTIHRDTPLGGNLKKVPVAELEAIAARVRELGIKTQVSG